MPEQGSDHDRIIKLVADWQNCHDNGVRERNDIKASIAGVKADMADLRAHLPSIESKIDKLANCSQQRADWRVEVLKVIGAVVVALITVTGGLALAYAKAGPAIERNVSATISAAVAEGIDSAEPIAERSVGSGERRSH